MDSWLQPFCGLIKCLWEPLPDCGGGERSLQDCGKYSLSPQHLETFLLTESRSSDPEAEVWFRVG